MGEEIKSTLDLVMERFKTEEDVVQLTDEQKQEIASIRKHYEAKIAEARILLADKEELSIEISRLERQRDEKLESVRKEAK